MKLLEYPYYAYQDLQNAQDYKHDIIRNMMKCPPCGYKFTSKKGKYSTTNRHKINYFLSKWLDLFNSIGGDKEFFLDVIYRRQTQHPNYLPYLKHSSKIPDGSCCFVNSYPLITYNNWILSIEDWVTLFYWWVFNGDTHSFGVHTHQSGKLIQSLLMCQNCLGIITNMKQTVKSLSFICKNSINHKLFHLPSCCPKLPTKKRRSDGIIKFLFHGSMNATPQHIGLRGGLYFLSAFTALANKYNNIEYHIIYNFPNYEDFLLPAHCNELKYNKKIIWHNKYLSKSAFENIVSQTDVLVLPSFSLHSNSIVQSLSRGIPVLTSSNWGAPEYITDDYNGWIAHFPTNTFLSWVDKNGVNREGYHAYWHINKLYEEILTEKTAEIIENPKQIELMSENALESYYNHFTVTQYKKRFKRILDQIYV